MPLGSSPSGQFASQIGGSRLSCAADDDPDILDLTTISPDLARRIALTAQGLASSRPTGRVDVRHFRRVMGSVGVLQLDSVNALSRSHYLPVFSRLGPYDRAALDAYTSHSGEVYEYWAHAASLLPTVRYPLFRWRMASFRPGPRTQGIEDEHPGYIETVYREIVANGPLTVAQLSDPGARTGPWWGHGRGRIALDWLFAVGKITAYRDHRFGRVYDLPERVIPPEYLAAEAPDEAGAYRELLVLAAAHHGIGTAKDLTDYYRLKVPVARPILEQLVADGSLLPATVPGWRQPAYLHPQAVRPRKVRGAALLSPFDSLIWERDRTERLFDFSYRIEIYVPEPDRVHGYYVLPFLLDGELVARVDLKSDRKARRLVVPASFAEDGADRVRVSRELAAELLSMAAWLGLDDVEIGGSGNLAKALRKAVG